jgi:lysophospholipase L1-like esterase
MRRRTFLRATLAMPGALALAACGRRKPLLPRIDDGGVILAFGDSLTFGTGASPEQSYPAALERLARRRVVRAGVPGETAAQGLARLPDALKEAEPQLLILCLGGNDLLRRGDERSVKSALKAMIELAKARGVSVVLMAPPRPGVFTDAPALYGELAKEHALPLEADILKSVLMDNALKSDLIHPNAKGYARIAEALAQLLKDSGAL